MPKRKKYAATDFGALSPDERRAKGDAVSIVDTRRAGIKRARVETQTMVDRYRRRGSISQRQYIASQKLYALWWASGSAPVVVSSYGMASQSSGERMSDRQVQARMRMSEALKAAETVLASILVHVCIYDYAASDWSGCVGNRRQGLKILREGLDKLANYWRL